MNHREKFLIIPFIFLIHFLGCRSTYTHQTMPQDNSIDSIKQLAEKTLSKPITYLPNQDSTFYACVSTAKSSSPEPFPLVRIVLIEQFNLSILYKDQYEGAEVEWIDPYQLHIWIPSKTADPSQSIYYDIRSRTIRRK